MSASSGSSSPFDAEAVAEVERAVLAGPGEQGCAFAVVVQRQSRARSLSPSRWDRVLTIYNCTSLTGCYIYDLKSLGPVLLAQERVCSDPISHLICEVRGSVLVVVVSTAFSLFRWEFAIEYSNLDSTHQLSLVDAVDCPTGGEVGGIYIFSSIAIDVSGGFQTKNSIFSTTANSFVVSLEGASIVVRSESFKKVRQFAPEDQSHAIEEFAVIEGSRAIICSIQRRSLIYCYDIEKDNVRFVFDPLSALISPTAQSQGLLPPSSKATLVSVVGLQPGDIGSFVLIYSDGSLLFYSMPDETDERLAKEQREGSIFEGAFVGDVDALQARLVDSLKLPSHFRISATPTSQPSILFARRLGLSIDSISIGVIAIAAGTSVCFVGLEGGSELLTIFPYSEILFVDPTLAVFISDLTMPTTDQGGDIIGSILLVGEGSQSSLMLSKDTVFNCDQAYNTDNANSRGISEENNSQINLDDPLAAISKEKAIGSSTYNSNSNSGQLRTPNKMDVVENLASPGSVFSKIEHEIEATFGVNGDGDEWNDGLDEDYGGRDSDVADGGGGREDDSSRVSLPHSPLDDDGGDGSLINMENLRILTDEYADDKDDNYDNFDIGNKCISSNENNTALERISKNAEGKDLSLFLRPSSDDPAALGSFLRKTLPTASTPVVKQGTRVVNGASNLSAVSGKPRIDKATGKVVDLPVTFHSKIKSSGYGQGPQDSFARMQLKKAQAKARQKIQIEKERELKQKQAQLAAQSEGLDNSDNNNISAGNGAGRRLGGPIIGSRIRSYPLNCEPMTQLQQSNTFPAIPIGSSSTSSSALTPQQLLPPVHKLCFNEDGSALAFATTDNNVSILRLPTSKYAGDALHCRGHNGAITHVGFSRDKNMVISSSKDGTARIWRNNPNPDPLVPSSAFEFQSAVIFSHILHPPNQSLALKTGGQSLTQPYVKANQTGQKGVSKNVPFGEEIHFAKFFFMDKFAAISSKSSIFMYLFDLGNTSNDLRRLQASPGTYKIAHRWTLTGTRMTSFNCINTVHSALLFAATSDKKLHILDAESGGLARSIDLLTASRSTSVYSHDRSIHSIALPSPSLHASVTTDHFNFFVTAAIDNSVLLWDLRQAYPTHRYSGHVNRKDSCGVAISPCLKYVSVGSEDRSAYILDVRCMSDSAERLVPLARLSGHGDVVSDVSFHPVFPQLATGSHDGRIRFFRDPSSASSPMFC